MKLLRTLPLAASALACATLVAPVARADDLLKQPGNHPPYFVEIEPHVDLAYGSWTSGVGGGSGYGVGARLSFPVVKNGFVSTINNSVAVGVGLDFLHFGCGFEGYSCTLNSLSLPVVLQWNFYITRQWSVFGEPGIFIYHQFFSESSSVGCDAGGCVSPTTTSLLPALYVGARYILNDRLAVTMRVGYPTLSLGMSFFD